MKVLVVDDDSTNRLVLKGLLKKEGHETVMAEDGQQAVDLFRESSPDMILMDVMMPVMDGYEATKIIKAESGDKFVPVLFLTAMGGDEALVSCLENGGDDYLAKPINRSVLVAKIRAMNRIHDLHTTVVEQRHELALFRDWTKTEQEVAEKIFSNIIKRGDDEIPIVKVFRQSADSFNGDIVLTVRNPSRGVNILVGDFTGHGLAAAIGAIPVAEIFYAMSKKDWPISDIVSEINRKISAFLPKGRFLAATVLQIDVQCKNIAIWNGGMPEVIVTDGKTGKISRYIESKHLPLGVFSPTQFESQVDQVAVEHGERLVMYSDGVTEAENRSAEMYGLARLEAAVTDRADDDTILTNVVRDLTAFREETEQNDDITLVELICDKQLLSQMKTADKPDAARRQAKHCVAEFVFSHETLNYYDPIPMLVETVKNMGIDITDNENLFMIFSELYNNSLDHGVLGLKSSIKNSAEGFSQYYIKRRELLENLDSGWIKIKVQYQLVDDTKQLEVYISDSGAGFDPSECKFDTEHQTLVPSGRGIGLLKSICEKIDYNKENNELMVMYAWK